MSAKAVREYRGKKLVAYHVQEVSKGQHVIDDRSVLITRNTDLETLPNDGNTNNSWLLSERLVVKPDQLIKRRGKAGLVGINLSWEDVKVWIAQRMETEITLEGKVTGQLHTFIVEIFVAHTPDEEYYVCLQSNRTGEELLFHHEGGIDVGNVDAKAHRVHIDIAAALTTQDLLTTDGVLSGVPAARRETLASFIVTLLAVYRKLNFTYMEINPIVFGHDGTIVPLDLAAKIDETAAFLNSHEWSQPIPGPLDLPAPFGRNEFPEEAYIKELDSKTGASLKLTVLNPSGRIWTMVRLVL